MHTSSSQLLLGKKDALIQSPQAPTTIIYDIPRFTHHILTFRIVRNFEVNVLAHFWTIKVLNISSIWNLFDLFVDFFHHHSPHHLHVAGLPAGHVGAEARACGHHCQPCWAGRDKQAGKGTVTVSSDQTS